MNPLPLPLRIAAGLVATAVEQARDLPRHVVELPVTAVSQALQVSMRVQQKVTELAIKGDRALGALRPVEERPSWATFDEELPRNGASTVTELRPARRGATVPDAAFQVATPPPPADNARADNARADDARADDDGPLGDTARAAGRSATNGNGTDRATGASRPGVPPAAGLPAAPPDGAGPAAMPGYPALTIPQLRGRLRFLSLDDLRALLLWETGHEARAPYVSMLTNRIASVSSKE